MEIKEKAKNIVEQMTLEEKASFVSGKNFWQMKGIERLGLKEHMVTDGPHGLRKQLGGSDHLGINKSVPATSFPTAVASACSFDPALLEEMGESLGEKCNREEVAVILGPGVNMKRSPLCGRNFEYFSEDPYLAGEMATGLIKGIQSKGVGTSIKHFAVNSQETRRMSINSVIDERAFREIYLTAFEHAVKQARPWTVMCSYNKINGTYASENKYLLTDILRDEWGFDGMLVTDWGASNQRVKGIKAGMDLEMPSSGEENAKRIVKAVQTGELSKEDLDNCVQRVVSLVLKAQQEKAPGYMTEETDHVLARKVATESTVLLKNDGILPLKKEQKVAFLGQMAKSPRYQGAGSSKIVPSFMDVPYDMAKKGGYDITYADGYDNVSEAVNLAKEADVAVIFAGLPDSYESEGYDRDSMDMPKEHIALIDAVASVNPNVVVVLMCGSPVTLPWKDKVKGILLPYLAGQASGGAIVDLLWGAENPCGKLAETWPMSLSDTPSYCNFPGYEKSVEYRESIFIGYRYYDTFHVPVNYSFGDGLSYTTFSYEDLRISQTGKNQYKISVKVKNTGSCYGKEVVQVYVGKDDSEIIRAIRELKGFQKIGLDPGEEKTVEISLDEESFRYYNMAAKQYCVEGGSYTIYVGGSLEQPALCERITVEGDGKEALLKDEKKLTDYWYDASKEFHPSQEQFEKLLGRRVPPRTRDKYDPFTTESTITDMKDTFIGKQMIKQMEKAMGGMVEDNTDEGMARMAKEMAFSMPLRSFTMTGTMTLNQIEGMVEMANKHYFKGIGKMIKK